MAEIANDAEVRVEKQSLILNIFAPVETPKLVVDVKSPSNRARPEPDEPERSLCSNCSSRSATRSV